MIDKFKIIFWLILMLVIVGQVRAAGIGVTPSKLYFEQQAGSKKSDYFKVENLSAEPVIFNLYADEFENEIVLEPNNFRLEVGAYEKVKITVRPDRPGIFATNISIVAQDLDRRKFNVSTGVKIPLELRISPAPVNQATKILKNLSLVLSLLIIVAIIVIVIIKRRKKKWYEKLGDSVDLLVHHKRPWWEKIIRD